MDERVIAGILGGILGLTFGTTGGALFALLLINIQLSGHVIL